MHINWQYSWIKIVLASLTLVFMLAMWSYVYAEVLTFSIQFDATAVCGSDIKYYKLLSFDERAGRAEILCIKNQASESSWKQLSLQRIGTGSRSEWTIVYTKPAYPEKSFIWPIYL